MSLALNAAPFVREEPITENIKKKLNSTENIKKKLRNKTEKKEVSFVLDENDDNDNDLVDFAPANEKPNKTSELVSEITENSNTDSFAYENIGFFSDNFNKPKIIENMNVNSNSGNSNSLEKKVNYLIEMLEKQNEKKTDYVTEEIVLYLFLGIFIIYTVDSFTRINKYTR
jgi:hypothetical protein